MAWKVRKINKFISLIVLKPFLDRHLVTPTLSLHRPELQNIGMQNRFFLTTVGILVLLILAWSFESGSWMPWLTLDTRSESLARSQVQDGANNAGVGQQGLAEEHKGKSSSQRDFSYRDAADMAVPPFKSATAKAGSSDTSVTAQASELSKQGYGRDSARRGDQPPDAADQEPIANFIRGQVLFSDGTSVPGARVEATAHQLFTDPMQDERSEAKVYTSPNGHFDISHLSPGEYVLKATASGKVTTLASMTVRTGSNDVRLIIAKETDVMVDGYVTSVVTGQPLADVMVEAQGLDVNVLSAIEGNFVFSLKVPDNRNIVLALKKQGFEPELISIDPATRDEQGVILVDATMKPTQSDLTVEGVVRDDSGKGLAGKQIYVKKDNSKYHATTDSSGAFLIDGIRSPGSYFLWVSADGLHDAYEDRRFNIPEGGVKGHVIQLKRLGVGNVTGLMRDSSGHPVANFTMVIQSSSAPQEPLLVTSDAKGFFAADNIPAGNLRIQTQSFPRYITSGLTLAEGATLNVEVLLDLGVEQIRGRVTDDAGQPVAGADMTLSWVLRQGATVNESLRTTTTDRSGNFVFTGLGMGPHDLMARAPHLEANQLTSVNPSRSDFIQLELRRQTK